MNFGNMMKQKAQKHVLSFIVSFVTRLIQAVETSIRSHRPRTLCVSDARRTLLIGAAVTARKLYVLAVITERRLNAYVRASS